MVAVRAAQAGEAPSLTALCLRSKAHWGYDAAFMRLCVPSLTVSEQSIAEGRVLVAMLSTRREPAVAVYPDSDKIGMWPPGKLFRLADAVDYWEGET